MTTYFTRATASLPLVGGNIAVSADNPGSASNVHIIPLNIHNTPINLSYFIYTGPGTGNVSASTSFTIDTVQDTNITPIWFGHFATFTGATVGNITFPIQAFRFSVNVSGSANYAASLLQPGM